jgi:phage I-like protein
MTTAATTAPLHAAFSNRLESTASSPSPELQYMPPGRHRIRASQGGKPLSVEVAVDAQTAVTLQTFLAARLTAAAEGHDDRPFFDFNHEDREASAWPTEFYWAGDDPQGGGVRARLEWSDAGKRAVEGRTFRRFSPTFHLDASGQITGSEINMGGLVNRAAFKRIAPLFASEIEPSDSASAPPFNLNFPLRLAAPLCGAGVDTTPAAKPMQTLLSTLRTLTLIEASATEELDLVAQVTRSVASLKSEITDLKSTLATQARQLGIEAPLLGGDGWDSEKLYEIGGKALEGSYFSNHYSVDDPAPRIQAFVAAYKAKFAGQAPDGLAAAGYDAMGVLASALERGADTQGPALRDAIAATKDFDGVTGRISIDAHRNAVKAAVVLKVAPAGKFEFVQRVEP